jgi:hypothetical protein
MAAASKWQSPDEEGGPLWGGHGSVLAGFGCVRPSRPLYLLRTLVRRRSARGRDPTSRKARMVGLASLLGIMNKDSFTYPDEQSVVGFV